MAVDCLAAAVEDQVANGDSLRSGVLDGFERANESILGLGLGAATTLAVVAIDRRALRPYHAGDSSILVTGQRGRIKLLTVSHSPVSYAVEAGMLDHQEALHHEDLNLVSNFVGSSQMRIDVGPVLSLSRRDTVVVASDGLFDNLHVEEIVDRVRKGPLEACANTLLTECQRRMAGEDPEHPSKADDLTFVLFRPGDFT
jgi:serine/threonine protein phosphatase PrpC